MLTSTGPGFARTFLKAADVTGTIVPGGDSVTVSITTSGDNGRLTFNGSANQRIFVRFTGVTIGTSTCCSTLVSILKPDGATLGSAKFIGTSGGYLDTAILPTTGPYTILVDPQGTSTGGATVAAYDVPADPSPALVPSAAGGTTTLSASVPGQNLTPTFAGSAGQRIFVSFTNVSVGTSTCCSMLVSLRKPDGSTLSGTSKYVGTTGGFIDTLVLPSSGTYVIVADPDASSTGSTTIAVYEVPANPAPDLDVSDDPAWAELEAAVPGQNLTPTFAGTAGQRVFMNFPDNQVGTSTCCADVVSLRKPDGTTLSGTSKYVGTTGGSSIPLRCLSAGLTRLSSILMAPKLGQLQSRLTRCLPTSPEP
jgi:hypothetical protein